MKSTGRILFSVFLFISSIAGASIEVNTQLDRRVIETGESAVLSITIPGEPSGIDPQKVPSVKGLEIKYSGMSVSYSNINGNVSRGVILSFRISGLERGKFLIPPFQFKSSKEVYRSEPVTLIVKKGIQRKENGAHGYRGDLEASKKKVFLGEPLILRYYIVTAGTDQFRIEGIEKSPESRGFTISEIKETIDDGIIEEGGNELYRTHISSYILTPIETGKKSAGNSSMIITYGSPYSFFSVVRKRRLQFRDTELQVLPVPEEGKPSGYRGDVGNFTIDAVNDEGKLEVFQERNITLVVRGTGNFLSLSKPEIENKPKGLRMIMEETGSKLNIRDNRIEGEKTFRLTVIPDEPGDYNIGKIRLSFFDPLAVKYGTAETENIKFSVSGDKKTAAVNKGFEKSENAFSMPVIGGIVAVAVIALLIFLLYEKKNIKRVESEIARTEDDEHADVRVSDGNVYLDNMRKALSDNDTQSFLQSAENFININSSLSAGEGETDISEREKLKEKVFNSRYGGRAISADDMKELFEKLQAAFRNEG